MRCLEIQTRDSERRRKQDESKVKASVVEVEGEIQQKY